MNTVSVVLPIVLVALVGYLAAQKEVVSARDVDGLSRFVFRITLPALLLDSLAHVTLPDRFNWQFLISYYMAVLIIYGLGMWMSRRYFAHSAQEQGVFGFGASYSNLMLVGLPVISAGLGDEALLPLFMLVAIHSAVLFCLLLASLERGNGYHARSLERIVAQTSKMLVTNPIVIGLTLGILINVSNLSIPQSLAAAIEMIGSATLPCALFVLGASLSTYKIAGHFTEAGVIVGLKMIAMPFVVWLLAFKVFHIDPLWGAVAVLAAGMPIGVSAYIFAQEYRVGNASLSTAILLSTALAVVSQSVLLALFV